MQIILLENANLAGPVSMRTEIVDMEGIAAFTVLLNVLDIKGTSPQVSVQVRTSDDLETWTDIGSAITANAAGQDPPTAFRVTTTPYSRYVQAVVTLSGTDPSIVVSLTVNTYTCT